MPVLACSTDSTWRKKHGQSVPMSCEIMWRSPTFSAEPRCVAKQQEMKRKTKQTIWRHLWLGRDLVDLGWDSMLTFSLTIFQGFLWATAYIVLRKMTSNHRTFYTTFPRKHPFLSKKKLGIWPWDKNLLLWSWHVFTAKNHNSSQFIGLGFTAKRRASVKIQHVLGNPLKSKCSR